MERAPWGDGWVLKGGSFFIFYFFFAPPSPPWAAPSLAPGRHPPLTAAFPRSLPCFPPGQTPLLPPPPTVFSAAPGLLLRPSASPKKLKMGESLQASFKTQLRETLNSMKINESLQASIKTQLQGNLKFDETGRIAPGIL